MAGIPQCPGYNSSGQPGHCERHLRLHARVGFQVTVEPFDPKRTASLTRVQPRQHARPSWADLQRALNGMVDQFTLGCRWLHPGLKLFHRTTASDDTQMALCSVPFDLGLCASPLDPRVGAGFLSLRGDPDRR